MPRRPIRRSPAAATPARRERRRNPGRAIQRRLPAPDRRRAILEAAKAVFLEQGIEHISMRSIAKRAGLSATALYLYFEDKEALMRAICGEIFARLIAGFVDTARGIADPIERLRATLAAYVRFGLDNPGEYRLLFMTPVAGIGGGHRPPTGEPDEGARAFAMLEQQVAALMATGRIRKGDPAMVAECLWAAGHGLVALLITHAEFPWSPREALIEMQIDIVIRGLTVSDATS